MSFNTKGISRGTGGNSTMSGFSLADIKKERDKRAARTSYLKYMHHVWQKPNTPLITGFHTRTISAKLDECLEKFKRGESSYLLVTLPFRHGKAVSMETLIPTPEGFKTMESIAVGDQVYGMDGKICNVIAKSPVWKDDDLYKMTFNKGKGSEETIIAGGKHEWLAKLDRRQPKLKLYETNVIGKPRKTSVQVPMLAGATESVVSDYELPIEPYTLGVWLGDGTKGSGSISGHTLDLPFIREGIINDGYSAGDIVEDKRSEFGCKIYVKGFVTAIRSAELFDSKYIPSIYLRASPEARLALLQGLIDTDGEVAEYREREGKNSKLTGGQITFGNTNKNIAEGVQQIVRSLGYKASLTTCRAKLDGKDYGLYYKVSFYMKGAARLPRKADLTRDPEKFLSHSVRAEYIGKGDTQCITVDSPDHMFLVGKSMIPTHNSDMFPRMLPARFLGQFPHEEVMVTSYSADLTRSFSRDARSLIQSPQYRELYPGINLSKTASNVKEWALDNDIGKTAWAGLNGALTGKGFALGIVDDFYKGREQAESEKIREKFWEGFTNDFLTRRAPVHIIIVDATSWHVDDFFGRIRQNMKENPDFPRFEELVFPARACDYTGEGEYPHEFLFEERFGAEWYRSQYATLNGYAASGLLDCNPAAKSGNLLKGVIGENLIEVPEKPEGFGIFVRAWDLASTEEERTKNDPDYTVGIKGAVKPEYHKMINHKGREQKVFTYSVYVDDIVRMRKEAPARDLKIKETAFLDGAIPVGVEGVAGYKDTYTTIKKALKGIVGVKKLDIKGDKTVKAGMYIEGPLELGKVYFSKNIQKKYINALSNEINSFPYGAHDDLVDALYLMVALALEKGGLASKFGKM